jgi:hypothetical protein
MRDLTLLEKLLANRITGSLIMPAIAVGAVISIALGFRATYQAITLIGN